uniref:TNFR-Cys domain-containing protein n=1 Tax=Neogobius melanostomus TaxID=47308 RepID=A0A8C6WKK1_9GOBI
MEFLHLSLQLLCLLSITGLIITCELERNGVCCNKCAPGFYVEKLCSNPQQTICKPCPHGSFSDNHHFLHVCNKCRTCEQANVVYVKCSCGPGFLCSNNICTKCEKFRCVREKDSKQPHTHTTRTNTTTTTTLLLPSPIYYFFKY